MRRCPFPMADLCSPELQILEHLASSGYNDLTGGLVRYDGREACTITLNSYMHVSGCLQRQWQLEENANSLLAQAQSHGAGAHHTSKVRLARARLCLTASAVSAHSALVF
jgi:hypothetical protein